MLRLYLAAARLRALLGEEGDFPAVLRGAGLVVIIRVLASAAGFASVVLLARWLGSSEYGLYSFAVAAMILLAHPATLGLPGAAVRFVAQHAADDDWQHVVGFMRLSSWLAFGSGTIVAGLAIAILLFFETYLDPGYIAPTILALAGVPVVALSIVRSEAIRGLGWVALAWGPMQLGQPVLHLAGAGVILLVATHLTAVMAVGISIVAYAVTLIAQWVLSRMRLGAKTRVEPKVQPGTWLGVAVSFIWISLATLTLLQAGVIVVGIFLTPHDVAVYSAAAATSGFVTLPLYAAVALGAPKFAALHAQDRRAELQSLYTDITRWTFWPSLVIALGFVTFGSILLGLFGPGFEQGYMILTILALGNLVSPLVGPVVSLLNMTGHQAVTAQVLGASAMLAVTLSLIFTSIWGIAGTASAFAAAIVLWNAWLAFFAVRKLGIFPSLRLR